MSVPLENQITAIIPTLTNTSGLLQLIGQLEVIGIIPIIIDNQPNEIKRQLTLTHPNLIYLPQSQNLGFAKATNLGAIQAKTDWLLILNDDVEGITSLALEHLIAQAVQSNWQAVSPILVNQLGQIENIGYRVLPIGKVELNFNENKNSDRELDGLTAACLLIKTHVFRQLYGLDESFFAYLEDVDLFLRVKQLGFHFGIDPTVRVTHQHRETSSKLPQGFKEKRDLLNWWRVVYKNPKRFIFTSSIIAMLTERFRNISGLIKVKYGK